VTSWFVFYLIKAKGVEDAAQVCACIRVCTCMYVCLWAHISLLLCSIRCHPLISCTLSCGHAAGFAFARVCSVLLPSVSRCVLGAVSVWRLGAISVLYFVLCFTQAGLRVSGLELGGLFGSLLAGKLSDWLIGRAKGKGGNVGKRVQVRKRVAVQVERAV